MRWLITGGTGMVGSDLRDRLEAEGEEVSAPGHVELDITDRAEVMALVERFAPSVLVNCAAFTKVDDCEAQEALATRVNGDAVGNLVAAANRANALLIQLSTDFVFDGSKRDPYEPDDATAPLSAYGRSKLCGEARAVEAKQHLILRTSWLFGQRGWSFVEAIRRQVDGGRQQLRVVDDQRGRPTYTPHLAEAIVRLGKVAIQSPPSGSIVHYADSPDCTWFDLAKAIVEELDRKGRLPAPVTVSPVTSDEFPRPARRPSWSVLSTTRYEALTGASPRAWRDGLEEMLVSD